MKRGWVNTQEYRKYEEVVKVRDKYQPKKSIYKTLGKMVREILSEHSLIIIAKEYYDELLLQDANIVKH